jgi:hypothetical protein
LYRGVTWEFTNLNVLMGSNEDRRWAGIIFLKNIYYYLFEGEGGRERGGRDGGERGEERGRINIQDILIKLLLFYFFY